MVEASVVGSADVPEDCVPDTGGTETPAEEEAVVAGGEVVVIMVVVVAEDVAAPEVEGIMFGKNCAYGAEMFCPPVGQRAMCCISSSCVFMKTLQVMQPGL